MLLIDNPLSEQRSEVTYFSALTLQNTNTRQKLLIKA